MQRIVRRCPSPQNQWRTQRRRNANRNPGAERDRLTDLLSLRAGVYLPSALGKHLGECNVGSGDTREQPPLAAVNALLYDHGRVGSSSLAKNAARPKIILQI
jgi:hypothetical protein